MIFSYINNIKPRTLTDAVLKTIYFIISYFIGMNISKLKNLPGKFFEFLTTKVSHNTQVFTTCTLFSVLYIEFSETNICIGYHRTKAVTHVFIS